MYIYVISSITPVNILINWNKFTEKISYVFDQYQHSQYVNFWRRFLAILAWTRHKRQHCYSAVISQIPACARSAPAGRTARARLRQAWQNGLVGWLVGWSGRWAALPSRETFGLWKKPTYTKKNLLTVVEKKTLLNGAKITR